ncbi:MAG: hypothetical protein RIQ48_129 [Pseudomonadota bacterium]|jgi:hypothetical protein
MKWAIICGKIRNPTVLKDNINFLGKAKEQGLIENIILSTWENDLFLFPEILSELKKYKIIVIENKEHESTLNLKIKGNYLKQFITTHSGLKLCPDDSFVLKLRTDKSAHVDGFNFKNVTKLLETNPSKFINLDRAYGLNYKIGLAQHPAALSHYVPAVFFWNDKFYFGQKEDLLKIVNFNFLNLSSYNLVPEQNLWVNYFISYHPELMNLFEACNQQYIFDMLFFNMDNWQGLTPKIRACHNFIKNEKLIVYTYMLEVYLLNKIGFCFDDSEIFNIKSLPGYINHSKFNLTDEGNLKKINEYFSNKKLVSLDIKRIQNFLFETYKIPKLNLFLKNSNKYEDIESVFSYYHNLLI